MKMKECLENAYIMGIQTVGESFYNVVRNSHLYFKDHTENMEIAQLTRELRNYDDETLVVDILTKKEMATIDKQLEEDLK